jgi:hypothetical protein
MRLFPTPLSLARSLLLFADTIPCLVLLCFRLLRLLSYNNNKNIMQQNNNSGVEEKGEGINLLK